MKKRLITVCVALAVLSACQTNEFENEDVPVPDDRVALGIGSATASMTKALLTPGTQTTDGMTIGLFATGTDYYADEGSTANHSATFTYGSNSWSTTSNIYLTAAIATIYGYYPADAALTKDATAPKVAVKVLAESAEIPTTPSFPSNASGEWRAAGAGGETDVNSTSIEAGTSAWFNKKADDASLYKFGAATGEIDYMAFIPAADKGRLTNNGKANNGVTTDNNLGLNPGYTIPDLTLDHGMAMVSFRLYNDGGYKGQADWTKLELKNAPTKTVLSKGTSPTMNLADAKITPGTPVAATFTRTIASKAYKVPVVVKDGDASASVVTTAKEATAAANKISCLVLPITSAFSAGDMQVVLTVDGTAYPAINIPATAPANVWEKGKNYIYTLKLGGHGIELTSVTVNGWTDVNGGEIPVN